MALGSLSNRDVRKRAPNLTGDKSNLTSLLPVSKQEKGLQIERFSSPPPQHTHTRMNNTNKLQ